MKFVHKTLVLAFLVSLIFATTALAAQEFEPNNDSTNANPVSCEEGPFVGTIDSSKDIDFYAIDLEAGQDVAIDVDTGSDSALDSFLEVFASNNLVDSVAFNDYALAPDDTLPDDGTILDSYLVFPVPENGTYYVAVSSEDSSGAYTISFQCSTRPDPLPDVIPVEPDSLLGLTASESGSLISINPSNGASTFNFALGAEGRIADIEFHNGTIIGATVAPIDGGFGSIITIDPETGVEDLLGAIKVFKIDSDTGQAIRQEEEVDGGVIALELVEGMLYGIYFGNSQTSQLVTVDQSNGEVTIVGPIGVSLVRDLAYDRDTGKMYGVLDRELIVINLGTGGINERVLLTDTDQLVIPEPIVALEFDQNGTLFGATIDRSGTEGKLAVINPDDATVKEIGSISLADGTTTGVNGLTFVPGAEDQNQVKTICSSSLTSPSLFSSRLSNSRHFKSKLRNNHLHRAFGFFKFEVTKPQKIYITLRPEVEELAGDCNDDPNVGDYGTKKAFLGLRAARWDLDFRKKTKGPLPLDIVADLPEAGWYRLLVIQPVPRRFRIDYCLTLDSEADDSTALETFSQTWLGESLISTTTSTTEKDSSVGLQAVSTGVNVVVDPAGTDTEGSDTGKVDEPDDGRGDEPVADDDGDVDTATTDEREEITGEPDDGRGDETVIDDDEELTEDDDSDGPATR